MATVYVCVNAQLFSGSEERDYVGGVNRGTSDGKSFGEATYGLLVVRAAAAVLQDKGHLIWC